MKKKVVFSAINVTAGGPLTILLRFMEFASSHLTGEYDVWFLVHDRSVLNRRYESLNILEFPNARRTPVHKLYYEYWYFKKLSREMNVHLWFSLNDCTPSVVANRRAVYIHNATPFYRISLFDLRFPSRVLLQKFYYRFFLRTNLRKNDFVVVQQEFMRKYVCEDLSYPDAGKVLVNRPVFSIDTSSTMPVSPEEVRGSSVLMIYSAKAEVYKNLHTLIDAAIHLVRDASIDNFTLWLTVRGRENRYARYLARKAGKYPQIVFKGAMSYPVLMGHVDACDIVVFPSRLETWGLPLSEGAHFNKWIVAADLPYARETLKNYGKVLYCDPTSAEAMADKIREAIAKVKTGSSANSADHPEPSGPESLAELFHRILG